MSLNESHSFDVKIKLSHYDESKSQIKKKVFYRTKCDEMNNGDYCIWDEESFDAWSDSDARPHNYRYCNNDVYCDKDFERYEDYSKHDLKLKEFEESNDCYLLVDSLVVSTTGTYYPVVSAFNGELIGIYLDDDSPKFISLEVLNFLNQVAEDAK